MQVQRARLLAALAIVRPALVGRPYIQSLSHVLLDKGWLTAYNESIAITTWLEDDVATIGACVPGEQLIAALGPFGAEAVEVVHAEGGMTVSSGKARIKLATLPATDFLYRAPDWSDDAFELPQAVIDGIACCLMGVGKDETMPATLGVTMAAVDGMVVLFSSDNRTITRFGTDAEAPAAMKGAVLLPTQFCEQVVALAKLAPAVAPIMVLRKDSAIVDFDGAAVLTARLQDEFELVDFQAKVDDIVPASAYDHIVAIPDGFDGAMARASLALGSGRDQSVRVSIKDGVMAIEATAATASSRDELAYPHTSMRMAFSVDPQLVMRGARACADLLPLEGALVMMGREGKLLHLVAHVAR